MDQRGPRHIRGAKRSRPLVAALVAGLCTTLSLAGCAHIVSGEAVSVLYNPARVGGLPVTDGPNGPRDNAPAPTGTVKNTDDGEIDHLALLAINDLEDYWQANYTGLDGSFKTVPTLVSYDSTDRSGSTLCGEKTYKLVNAMFGVCSEDSSSWQDSFIAWDRGVFMPAAEKYFGKMAVVGVLAHEYGHALQTMSGLTNDSTATLVKEQQADCFGGVYLQWVAAGSSSRFTMNTTDGLNHLLAGVIYSRDPVVKPGEDWTNDEHGTALDRISAFQMGFDTGTSACTGIDMDEIEQRRGDLPMSLRETSSGVESGDVTIDKDVLATFMDEMKTIFAPQQAPTLSYDAASCADAEASPPASYCPATNTITVDLTALKQMGTPATEDENKVLLQGDNTALSVVMSRYTFAVQREHGVGLTSAMAGLRTACLTGAGQRKMAESDQKLTLSAGDVDEAISGLLTNGLAASDVDGTTVPAGFTRILAFRSGLLGTADQCYERFA